MPRRRNTYLLIVHVRVETVVEVEVVLLYKLRQVDFLPKGRTAGQHCSYDNFRGENLLELLNDQVARGANLERVGVALFDLLRR